MTLRSIFNWPNVFTCAQYPRDESTFDFLAVRCESPDATQTNKQTNKQENIYILVPLPLSLCLSLLSDVETFLADVAIWCSLLYSVAAAAVESVGDLIT